ncbi:MAG: T9SS type A sorting domain-containing protein [Flavobacteriia bacterium]|nr:T9SS type A sorting domain-containing protein [Flavobacteriia bacterium]
MKFSVEQREDAAFLDWVSGEEGQISEFIVEKSIDGVFWFEISIISPHQDSVNIYHNSYMDTNLADGTQYYRVQLLTPNGESIFSEVSSFKLEKDVYIKPELFPNPSSGIFILKYTFLSKNKPEFNLVTSRGRVVDLEPVNTVGMYTFDISELYAGVYFLQIIEGDKVTRVKISKK